MKTKILAASIALALVGCNDSNSNTSSSSELAKRPEIAIPQAGQFIDAQVSGLYFVKGELSNEGEFTKPDGTYSIDTNNPSVTFILGNRNGGLVLGSSSGRDVVTPYEVVGTHDRAVNLARLLLTINTHSDNSTIVIPDEIKDADVGDDILKKLGKIQLDDLDSAAGKKAVDDVLTLLGKDVTQLIDANAALVHFGTEGSIGTLTNRGSDVLLTHWSRGSNWTFVERSAVQRIRPNEGAQFQIAIHADRTLGEKVFNQTIGLAGTSFKLEQDAFVMLKGSNDSTISSSFSAQYLSCIAKDGEFSWGTGNNGGEVPLCSGEHDIELADPVKEMANSASYTYVLTDMTAFQSTDERYAWEGGPEDDAVADMGGAYKCMAEKNCSEQVLTRFSTQERSDENDKLNETLSGSYDPITDVYTEVASKEYVDGYHKGRVSESIRFIYPVEKAGDERYVDFKGEWRVRETRPDCEVAAESVYTFDDTGLTMQGQEFSGSCNLKELETVHYSYQNLAEMDFWWFGTNLAGASKATLDQLNTTVRWNDKEGEKDHYKINRFSYIPAGKNWDRGVLTRYTLDSAGKKLVTITMQKN